MERSLKRRACDRRAEGEHRRSLIHHAGVHCAPEQGVGTTHPAPPSSAALETGAA